MSEKKKQNLSFLGRIVTRYRYQTGVVPVPNRGGTGTTWEEPKWYRYHDKVVSVPTTHQNRIGTDTDPSGAGTTASCSPDFGILTLLSPNL